MCERRYVMSELENVMAELAGREQMVMVKLARREQMASNGSKSLVADQQMASVCINSYVVIDSS